MNYKGTIILTIISLLERLSYYGVRVILILYVTDPYTFNIDQNQISEFYGYWALVLVVAAIPFGLMTDKFIGQKRSIFIGGILTLLGYLMLMIQYQYTLIISLLLIVSGTSLVKPSTTILVGRQFKKENKNRTLAYMVFFMGINIGAFIGSLGIGYLGEVYAWKYGFIVAAISTIVYLLIAYFFRLYIKEIETNELSNQNQQLSLNRSVLILPLLILIHIVFWKNHEVGTTELIAKLINLENKSIFGYELLDSMLHGLSAIWTIPLTISAFLYWYFKGVPNLIKGILISLLLLILAFIGTFIFYPSQLDDLIGWSMIPIGLFALAEVIISPILISYVTRIADVNYSNTIYTAFIFLTYVLGVGFVYLLQNEYQSYISITILTLMVFGIILFKDQISELTYGLK